MNLNYYFNTRWEVRLGIGYLWTKAWIRMLESFHFESFGQKILAMQVSPSILCSNGNKTKIGLECRFMKKIGYAWGREISILFLYPVIEREFNSKFKYGVSFSARFGIGKTTYMFATERKNLFDYDIIELSLKIDFIGKFATRQ